MILPRPAFAAILATVSQLSGIPQESLLCPRRFRDLARPRQVVMWVAHRRCGYSYPWIGRQMRRDHSTVMHGADLIERLRETDPEIRQLSDAVVAELERAAGQRSAA